jgi:hypothetical protein
MTWCNDLVCAHQLVTVRLVWIRGNGHGHVDGSDDLRSQHTSTPPTVRQPSAISSCGVRRRPSTITCSPYRPAGSAKLARPRTPSTEAGLSSLGLPPRW